MNLFDAFDRLITEHGSATIMRERLTLIRDQMQALEKKVADLQTENAALVERNGELERQVLASARSEEFVEHRGALFKRRPGGGYSEQPYCFVCRKPMSSHVGIGNYHCMCGYTADFTGDDLPTVMRGLR
jgi:hypothetical protein